MVPLAQVFDADRMLEGDLRERVALGHGVRPGGHRGRGRRSHGCCLRGSGFLLLHHLGGCLLQRRGARDFLRAAARRANSLPGASAAGRPSATRYAPTALIRSISVLAFNTVACAHGSKSCARRMSLARLSPRKARNFWISASFGLSAL